MVAPRAGAGIEISLTAQTRQKSRSPPAWGRGLKLALGHLAVVAVPSPPRVGRELTSSDGTPLHLIVASHTGAGIEMAVALKLVEALKLCPVWDGNAKQPAAKPQRAEK